MSQHQPELPFFGSDQGYAHWHEELGKQRQLLEQKLGVPFGVKVQLTLRDFDKPFTGVIETVVGTPEANPRLRLRGERFDFSLDEICSITRLQRS